MHFTPKGLRSIAESNRRRATPLLQKFWDKVKVSSRCWEWIGTKDKDGYGMIQTVRGHIKAHRFSFELHRAEQIPQRILCCHSCDNPSCVNPEHLFLGSHKGNLVDAANKKRMVGNRKIGVSDVLTIRAMVASGSLQREVAKKFGIKQSQVSRIILRKRWKNV